MNLTAIIIVAIIATTIIKLTGAGEKYSGKKADLKKDLEAHKAEIAALKERVQTLEAIVTDDGYDLKKKFKDLDDDRVA
ncbi:hypothetical protein [Salinimonas chungwhensis]|uniref:hypothetical protein n=1 Tax=Salinimonas chungwhensis TaxID=265425 RepID=UPI00036FB015|nr:hypothetical protein [Salinimonas chungwhensis]